MSSFPDLGRPVVITRDESFLALKLVPVRLNGDGVVTASSQASGFFWRRGTRWYLVTNVHVLSGWNYEDNRSLSPTAFRPTHIDFVMAVEEQSELDGLSRFVGRRAPICEDGEPKWFVHPVHGELVDVAVLPLFTDPPEEVLNVQGIRAILSTPVNEFPGWVDYKPGVADDVFILGYPKGMDARGFSIWKRGSIASEPNLDIGKLPKFLVDTATREGMSGGPVIAMRRGLTFPHGRMDQSVVWGDATRFFGIYSGRLGEDPLGVQLGVVWKPHVIEEILDGRRTGTWP